MTSETGSDREARWLAGVETRFAAHAERFNSRELAHETGRAHVVCIGDSHLFVFRADLPQPNVTELLPHAWFDPCIVVGATARGLVNPVSRTNARNIFRRRIELAEPWQPVVIQLGEVDCGFLIWVRAEGNGEPPDLELERSIENYMSFVEEVRAAGSEQVFVLSAPLPTMGDAHEWEGSARARRSLRVSQQDRTELTRRFNAALAQRAGAYDFVDVTEPTLDPATGLIAREFVSPAQDDHHLHAQPWSRLIAERLGPRLRAPPA